MVSIAIFHRVAKCVFVLMIFIRWIIFHITIVSLLGIEIYEKVFENYKVCGCVLRKLYFSISLTSVGRNTLETVWRLLSQKRAPTKAS